MTEDLIPGRFLAGARTRLVYPGIPGLGRKLAYNSHCLPQSGSGGQARSRAENTGRAAIEQPSGRCRHSGAGSSRLTKTPLCGITTRSPSSRSIPIAFRIVPRATP
jgi:hypothetical protein